MKITVYTIKDCAFSKQEKEYLNTNKLAYEEKNLETNKDFLTEMLAVSNNFAGTPVTRVEKDDGSIAVLKGFTKEEFDTTFGFASPAEVLTKAGSTVPAVNDTPIPPVVETSPVVSTESVSPAPVPTDLPPAETPVTTTPDLSADLSSKVSTTEEASVKADPLKSVMDDLQSKSQTTDQSLPPTPPVPLTDANPPVVDPTAPAIPDFPAK